MFDILQSKKTFHIFTQHVCYPIKWKQNFASTFNQEDAFLSLRLCLAIPAECVDFFHMAKNMPCHF
jgi:hypothetical protein